MGLTAYLVLAGVVLCAGASFFFALAESALFSLGRWRAGQMADQPAGQRVLRLLEKPSELLATIALGNTMANGALVSLSLWPALTGRWSLGWTLAGVVGLLLVGCEIVPKTLAVRAPERWAPWVAGPMTLLQGATGWLQQLFRRFNQWLLRTVLPGATRASTSLTDEEYRELLDLAWQEGTLAQAEKQIILQILSLDRKTAKDVMKPRAQMAYVPDDLSIEGMIAAARRFKHRRLPILDVAEDTIVGVLNTSALLLDPQASLDEVIEPPSFVPETMNLLRLLDSLERQQRGLAIVLDEFGDVAGLVTIEDILAEVVGRLRTDTELSGLTLEKLGEGRWRAHGLTRLDDLRREYPTLPELPEVNTVGGLMLRQLEVVPAVGDSVTVAGLKLTALAADDRHVKEVLIEVIKRK